MHLKNWKNLIFDQTLLNSELNVLNVFIRNVRKPDVDARQVAALLGPQESGILHLPDDVVGANLGRHDRDLAVVDVDPLSQTENLEVKN